MIRVVCDICGRECPPYAGHLTFRGPFDATGEDSELHVCKPRDGGDAGCEAWFRSGIQTAQENAQASARVKADAWGWTGILLADQHKEAQEIAARTRRLLDEPL